MHLPTPQDRIAIVGKTGSGKTVAGLWHLSQQNFDEMPWVIFDWKRDGAIARLNIPELSLAGKAPTKPGIYVVRPMPNDDDLVEDFIWKLWRQGHTGLYVDEGYMMPKGSAAFQAVLTQGRSKYVPVIVLSQRPVWMSRFVFSEADFHQIFWMNDARDRKTVSSFIPDIPDERLPDFHSYYYDVGDDELIVLKPVPTEEIIIQNINTKLQPKKKSGLLTFT